MQPPDDWIDRAYQLLTTPFFNIGDASFSVVSILKLIVFAGIVLWASRLARRILTRRLLPRFHVDAGPAHALGNLVAYVILVVGVLVGLQTAGIELSTLTVIFGALGLGIGFGLQPIVLNFVSGLVLLLERPIQVGDRIQLGELHGRVTRIRARATEVLSNDNIAVIVPNSEFISQRVINWSHGGSRIRIRVPIGVAYGSDIATVRRALLEAAASVDAVLADPSPAVRLTSFGDSAIDFELLVWTSELLHRRGECISRVNFAIQEHLERNGIQIPFPQRDLHVRSAVPMVAPGP